MPPENATCDRSGITRAVGTVHNDKDLRHFMKLKPITRRVRVRIGERVVADSTAAIRVLEIGKDFYDPVMYLPRADVCAELVASEKSTVCPIKGTTEYFSLPADGQHAAEPDIAWSYVQTVVGARNLWHRIAFDPSRVTVEEGPE